MDTASRYYISTTSIVCLITSPQSPHPILKVIWRQSVVPTTKRAHTAIVNSIISHFPRHEHEFETSSSQSLAACQNPNKHQSNRIYSAKSASFNGQLDSVCTLHTSPVIISRPKSVEKQSYHMHTSTLSTIPSRSSSSILPNPSIPAKQGVQVSSPPAFDSTHSGYFSGS